ncbi:MAG: glycerophosphodiester phosphodiesterase family protein [Bacillota bacterium]
MKMFLIIVALVVIIFMLFYGGYYLIYPSLMGKDILTNLNIPYPAVIAHRGASIIAPESTAPAYIMARDSGADYLEADLHQTKDGEIVIFHDNSLKRTSNISEVFPERADKGIEEFTLAELKRLDVGSWFNESNNIYASEEYNNLKILTLEELIDIAENGTHTPGLVLELKQPNKYPDIEKNIVEILDKKGWLEKDEEIGIEEDIESPEVEIGNGPSRIIFFSFNLASLERLKRLAPQFPRLLLITDNRISRRAWNQWLNRAEGKVNGLGPKGFLTWPWHIAAAHKRGLFVFPYVINKAWQMQILSQFKSDGFITDRPKVVLSFLKRVTELPEITEILEEDSDRD